MPRLPTFSALERVMACPLSHVLPQSDVSGKWADQGRAVHVFLEHALKNPAAALAAAPEDVRALCAAIPGDVVAGRGLREVAFAYDTTDGSSRLLTRGGHRDYSSVKLTEIAGTLDLVDSTSDPLCVSDYKTGRSTTKAAQNPQLLAGALAATRYHDSSRARVELIYVHGADVWRDSAVVDTFDLLAFEGRLLKMVADIDDGLIVAQPAPNPGAYCRYCPAFAACPWQQQLAGAMTDGSLAKTVEGWCGLITRENAPDAYAKWRQMRLLTARVGDILAAWAKENGPIDIGDGRAYGPVNVPGNERLDGMIVSQVVAELYGPLVAMACIEPVATKAGLERGLATVPGLTSVSAAAKRVLSAVRERGGATRTASTKIKEHRP